MKFPVIVVGMHRSGTSLLSRVLELAGFFMGVNKDPNNEPFFFLNLNEWMFKQTNATWDNPYNFRFLDEEDFNILVRSVKLNLDSPKFVQFLGIKNFLKYRNLKNISIPWGWKDPRNTITLPVWLKLFPEAKVVHIYRNPVDVAVSLRNRVLKNRAAFKWRWKHSVKSILLSGKLNFVDSVRLQNLEEGIKLWEEYLKFLFRYEDKMGISIFHIKYEDFLLNPGVIVGELLNWLEVTVSDNLLNSIVASIDSTRCYAFKSDTFLRKLYENIRDNPLMVKLGYQNLI